MKEERERVLGGFNDVGWSLPTNQMNKQEDEQEDEELWTCAWMDERFGAAHPSGKKEMMGNELYVQKQTGRYSPIKAEKSVQDIMPVPLGFRQKVEKSNACALGRSSRKFHFKNDFFQEPTGIRLNLLSCRE